MPSASKSQFNFFKIAAGNKEFAEKRGLDFEMAKEWHEEDMKKLSEDPEWFKNLPEKKEKEKKDKKEKPEVSTESFQDMFADVMGFGDVKDPLYRFSVDKEFYFKWNVEKMEKFIEVAEFKDPSAKLGAIILLGLRSSDDIKVNFLDKAEKSIKASVEYLKEIYSKSFKGELTPSQVGAPVSPLTPFVQSESGLSIKPYRFVDGYIRPLTRVEALKANELIDDIQEALAELDSIAFNRTEELAAFSGYTQPVRTNLLEIASGLKTYIQQSMLTTINH